MKRSANFTKKLVLGNATIRELKRVELERIDGGSGSDTGAGEEKDPRGGGGDGGIVVYC